MLLYYRSLLAEFSESYVTEVGPPGHIDRRGQRPHCCPVIAECHMFPRLFGGWSSSSTETTEIRERYLVQLGWTDQLQ